jgi:heme-degrading monooxygenase HmoA
MIARVWRGTTTPADAAAYLAHLREATLPALREIDGHRGAYVLRRGDERSVEFLVVTLWSSLEAVRDFAGEDYGRAVVPAEAERLLVHFDERVLHYDVALSS